MVFLLSRDNVFSYLADFGYQSEKSTDNIEPLSAKNFNLLVTLSDKLKLLVKQERHNHQGKAAGEFLAERQIHSLIQDFPELQHWQPFLSAICHFDRENSILIFEYLQDYRDLMDFYLKENTYPESIARQLGTALSTIHHDTYQQQVYQDAISQTKPQQKNSIVQRLVTNLEKITPEIFGSVPDDGLKFYALYQRYVSLGQALAELSDAVRADCLTHNDLKLNNILLHNDWALPNSDIVRLIDWERSAWGDPAFDLGTLIGSYLQLWLNSLVVSKSLSIEESLSLAMTPLDRVQPSIAALTRAYLVGFPEIVKDRPDFIQRSVQFAGLVIIQSILASIEYQKMLGNSGISRLQVAKSLLCRPVQSMPTVFGTLEFMPQLTAVS
jgi:thiamine kinase-like enzyme